MMQEQSENKLRKDPSGDELKSGQEWNRRQNFFTDPSPTTTVEQPQDNQPIQEIDQSQVEKELLQIKELCESLMSKAELLLSKKGEKKAYYRELESNYTRALRSHPGYEGYKQYVRITEPEGRIHFSSGGHNDQSGRDLTELHIYKDSGLPEVRIIPGSEMFKENSKMIDLLKQWDSVLNDYVEKESEDNHEEETTMPVRIPENNGFYTQPDKISLVVDHIQLFDPKSTLVATSENGTYQLKIEDASKADIIKSVLAREYGFLV